jgi:hypothetical protein
MTLTKTDVRAIGRRSLAAAGLSRPFGIGLISDIFQMRGTTW